MKVTERESGVGEVKARVMMLWLRVRTMARMRARVSECALDVRVDTP